jgi:phosphoribosyl 1,2-cyclic phosphate phosphodiesterase
MYAFLIETSSGSRALLAPDELYQWIPPEHLHGVELAILQTGLFEMDPFTGARRLPEGFLERLGEMNFQMTLDLAKQLRAKRVIISHLEEPEGMSYTRYLELEKALVPLGLNISFAYDLQRIAL